MLWCALVRRALVRPVPVSDEHLVAEVETVEASKLIACAVVDRHAQLEEHVVEADIV